MNINYSGKSISFREFNQDSYATGEGLWDSDYGYLFVVCDGVGSQKQAHSASFRATETIVSQFYSIENTHRFELLVQVIEEVNIELHEEFREKPEATTVVAALIHQERLYIVHAGDSRAYLIRNNTILQLTTDHTVLEEVIRRGHATREELQKHPHDLYKLYQALGAEDSVRLDASTHELQGNEIIVLCTDGVWGYVEENVMRQIVQGNNCSVSVEKLTETAKENGGIDDATVIVIRYLTNHE